MPKVILEIYAQSQTDDSYSLFARTVVTDATIVPKVGEDISFHSAERGNSDATTLKVGYTVALASLDGYLVIFHLSRDRIAEDGAQLRRELHELDWAFVAPAPALPFTADDDDDEDD